MADPADRDARGAGQSFVYFAHCEREQAVKIGLSGNPARRLEQLQGLYPKFRGAVLRGFVPGDFHLEGSLHALFWHAHIEGEWFFAGPGILRAIERVLEHHRVRPLQPCWAGTGRTSRPPRPKPEEPTPAMLKARVLRTIEQYLALSTASE